MDAFWNQELARSLAIDIDSPAIIAVIKNKIYHFQSEYSIKNLRDFAKSIFPADLVEKVTRNLDDSYSIFYFKTNLSLMRSK